MKLDPTGATVVYFDTSYLVKCYTLESGTTEVRQLAVAQPRIACSMLGRVELVAAFHRKLREGDIDRTGFSHLLKQLEFDDSQGLWTWLPLTPQLLDATAAHLGALPANCFIRTADAIHLASTSKFRCATIYSSDKHLLNAAIHFGVRAENVIT